MLALGILGAGALVVVGGFAVALFNALRRKSVRTLALRDVRRRPAEAALVIAGSMLGAALITGSFIVGDTLDASIRATATTQLGPVDETIVVPDPRRARAIVADVDALGSDAIDGVTSWVAVPAAVASQSSGRTRAEPEAQIIELDFEDARRFGDDPEATGISGPTPVGRSTAISADLAETLGAEEGDDITAYLYGRPLRLEVVRVLPRLGLAGYWRGFESTSSNAFVAPRTIDDVAGGRIPGDAVPPQITIAVSNRGGVEDGATLTERVTRELEDVLPANARVDAAKQELLADAEAQGQEFSELFLSIGMFAILAGILLLVNIFVMLAEERKSQLGMLRAVGMRRVDLIGMFTLEGVIYGVVASALGALVGIGVGWAIVVLAAPIFGGGEEFSLDLLFSLEPQSLVGGFALGTSIAWMSVFLTSLRISRINIIRAIRDLPEPKLQRTRIAVVLLGGLLAAAAGAAVAWAFGTEDGYLVLLIGPAIVAFGLVPLLGMLIGTRAAVVLAAAFSLLWGIFGDTLLGGRVFEGGDVFVFTLQGVLLVFSAIILLSQIQENLEGTIRRVAAPRLPLRLAVAYPLARRFRTGLTLAMYALVMFTMTFIAVMSQAFGGQIETATAQEAGGFDILVTSSAANPPSPSELSSIAGVETVSTQLYGDALYRPQGFSEPELWPITGIERSFAEVGPPALGERAPGFESASEVWRTLLDDPETAVVDSFFLQEGGGGPPVVPVELGDTMEVLDPITGDRVERRVIGFVDDDQAFSGVYMSRASVEEVLGGRVSPNRFYVAINEGVDASAVASRMQGRFVEHGVEATSFRALVEDSQRFATQFLRILQGYLALGLVVGVAGLGVVMVRAVRERRREIGVLRSLGFLRAQVRSAFLFESGFQALEGILVGSLLALVTSRLLVENGDLGEGIEFVVPWLNVALLWVVAFVASLLATAWPARQASRIPPAVALRVAE